MASLRSLNHHAFPRSPMASPRLPPLAHLSSLRSATDSPRPLPPGPAHPLSPRSLTDNPKPLPPGLHRVPSSLKSQTDSLRLVPPGPPRLSSLRSATVNLRLVPLGPPDLSSPRSATASLRPLDPPAMLLGQMAPPLPPRSSLVLPLLATPRSVAWLLVSLLFSLCFKHFITSHFVISALICMIIAWAETLRSYIMDGKGGSLYNTL
jgi:hypothetical protein